MVRNPTRFRRGLGFSRVVKMKSMRHWTCRGTGRKSLGTSTILNVNSESSRFQGSAGGLPNVERTSRIDDAGNVSYTDGAGPVRIFHEHASR